MTLIACCEIGSRPARCVDTAMPFTVCVCSTQRASWRAAWIALWMTNPAWLTGNGESPILRPCRSIFTRLDAVISSKKSPYGLIRNWSSAPGDVGEGQILPAIPHEQPIAGRQIDAHGPLFL